MVRERMVALRVEVCGTVGQIDTTKKDITIYVDRKKTQIQGKLVEFWDVLLGDIRVTETSA